MKINQLINYLKDHGVKVLHVSKDGDKIVVEDVYCIDGVSHTQEVTITASYEEVRKYLGY